VGDKVYTALDAEKFERFFAEPSFGTALASSVLKIRQVVTGSNIELQIIEPEAAAAAAAAADVGGLPAGGGLRGPGSDQSASGDSDDGAAAAGGATTAAAGEPKTASAVAPQPAPARKQKEQKQVRGGRCVLFGGRLD
jgi:hypothetical protein